MNREPPDGDTLPPFLAELSASMTESPASVRKGLILSAVFPGLGEVYRGNVGKGVRMAALFAANIATGLVFFWLLYHYAKNFDPEKVNRDSTRRYDIFSILLDAGRHLSDRLRIDQGRTVSAGDAPHYSKCNEPADDF